jgi:DMSO/TMAO reductase YedYZ molybdopterin-dependent catalytic subunit
MRKLPPNQNTIDRLLRWGVDHPGIISVNPKISIDKYTLTVEGEVENPVKFRWIDFQ